MNKNIGIKLNDGIRNMLIEEKTSCYEILKKIYGVDYFKYLAVKVNNMIKELSFDELEDDDVLEFLDASSSDGRRVYIRTLSFVFIKACRNLYNQVQVNIEHSLNKGIYAEIKLGRKLTEEDLEKIINEVKRIVGEKLPINKNIVTVKKAKDIFTEQNMFDKVSLLSNWSTENLRIYELDGYYDTFYGYVAHNTDVIYNFDIKLFGNGVVLRYPSQSNIDELREYEEHPKLAKVFREAEDWAEIMEVEHAGALNQLIKDGKIEDLILINEVLHEKKIAYIADEISNDENIKTVLIAGPSSSGKTTFAQRLSLQLRVNGKKTFAISLDDYFVDRSKTPRDEKGNFDFDTIKALDVELFNEDLKKLVSCEEVTIPTFDFKTGTRIFDKKPITLTKKHIIIVEGIHGLNDVLTASIEKKCKFKIYISALTQLNIDNHNRISTSDTRLIRRIVRDNRSRGHNAEQTVKMWNSVRRGEEKHIFPYQENADAIFNSSLIYEFGILKKYASDVIKEIPLTSDFYAERQRLLKFLSYFMEIEDEKTIPAISILKEFMGGGILA